MQITIKVTRQEIESIIRRSIEEKHKIDVKDMKWTDSGILITSDNEPPERPDWGT